MDLVPHRLEVAKSLPYADKNCVREFKSWYKLSLIKLPSVSKLGKWGFNVCQQYWCKGGWGEQNLWKHADVILDCSPTIFARQLNTADIHATLHDNSHVSHTLLCMLCSARQIGKSKSSTPSPSPLAPPPKHSTKIFHVFRANFFGCNSCWVAELLSR